jgi:hypothetical protein
MAPRVFVAWVYYAQKQLHFIIIIIIIFIFIIQLDVLLIC